MALLTLRKILTATLLIFTGMMLGDSGIAKKASQDQSLLIRGNGFTIKAGHPDNNKETGVLGTGNGIIILEEGNGWNDKNLFSYTNYGRAKFHAKHNTRFKFLKGRLFDTQDKKIILIIKSVKNKKFGQYRGSIHVLISAKGKVVYSYISIRHNGRYYNITKGLENFNVMVQDSLDSGVSVEDTSIDGTMLDNRNVTSTVDNAVRSATHDSDNFEVDRNNNNAFDLEEHIDVDAIQKSIDDGEASVTIDTNIDTNEPNKDPLETK